MASQATEANLLNKEDSQFVGIGVSSPLIYTVIGAVGTWEEDA